MTSRAVEDIALSVVRPDRKRPRIEVEIVTHLSHRHRALREYLGGIGTPRGPWSYIVAAAEAPALLRWVGDGVRARGVSDVEELIAEQMGIRIEWEDE